MGYGKRKIVDIYTIGGKKVGSLYDSSIYQPGQAKHIEATREMSGWKEISFALPVIVNNERNWRADLMVNEHLIRTEEDGIADWYILSEPTDA